MMDQPPAKIKLKSYELAVLRADDCIVGLPKATI